MVTRLSGGLSPADGSDPRTFPQIWNVTAAEIEAQGTAISGAEADIDGLQSDVLALEAKNLPSFGTAVPTDGQVLTFSTAVSAYVPATQTAGVVVGENLLYNGAMQVHQRGTATTSITSSGYYTADRWKLDLSSLGTWTQSVENDGPSGSGFSKSLKMLCTTANTSPVAGAFNFIFQNLEGQDLQGILKGTSDAKDLTVSFWVKSNRTGTYIVFLQDFANNRSISAQYTVSASATWERKVITFPGDTTGVLANTNAANLRLAFALAAGSTYTSGTLNTSWNTLTLANLAVGQTNLAASTNNYWQVTGLQLEVGTVSNDFEFKPYGQELSECERYYQAAIGFVSRAISSSATEGICPLRTEMRSSPASVIASTLTQFHLNPAVAHYTPTAIVLADVTSLSAKIQTSGASGMTTGATLWNVQVIYLNAEL